MTVDDGRNEISVQEVSSSTGPEQFTFRRFSGRLSSALRLTPDRRRLVAFILIIDQLLIAQHLFPPSTHSERSG